MRIAFVTAFVSMRAMLVEDEPQRLLGVLRDTVDNATAPSKERDFVGVLGRLLQQHAQPQLTSFAVTLRHALSVRVYATLRHIVVSQVAPSLLGIEVVPSLSAAVRAEAASLARLRVPLHTTTGPDGTHGARRSFADLMHFRCGADPPYLKALQDDNTLVLSLNADTAVAFKQSAFTSRSALRAEPRGRGPQLELRRDASGAPRPLLRKM